LWGWRGDDQLTGNSGNDALFPDAGKDILIRGIGNDTFRFDVLNRNGNFSTVRDFELGKDKIWLNTDVFRGLTAANLNSLLRYDQPNGLLSYDPDGPGSSAAIKVARLIGSPRLTTDSFVLNGPRRDNGRFNITLDFNGQFTPFQQFIMEQAAEKWERVIVGELPDFNGTITNLLTPRAAFVDDLLVDITRNTFAAPVPGETPMNPGTMNQGTALQSAPLSGEGTS
jgi:hypothetical protein